jgi:hypothetical protein
MMGETVKVYMNLCMKIQVWLVPCKYRADVNVTLHIHTHTHTHLRELCPPPQSSSSKTLLCYTRPE